MEEYLGAPNSAATGRVVLVTGANRGIGLEVCRQLAGRGFRVVLTARDAGRGERAAEGLRADGLDVVARQLDVSDPGSVAGARAWVENEVGRLDGLVNNAAIDYDTDQDVLGADLDRVRDVLETNTLGAWRVTQAFLPLLRAGAHGRIVNVTSGAGSWARLGADTPAYSLSKAALNALTVMMAAALDGTGILVNAVGPGWVRTDMGGPGAPRSVEEGAASIVWGVTLPDDGPSGGFFRDGERVAW